MMNHLQEWWRLKRVHLSETTAIHKYDPEDKPTEKGSEINFFFFFFKKRLEAEGEEI